LRIETSPSVAGALFGALDYLTGYPYGCTEQTMSRFLPTVIVAKTLRDVRTATIGEDNNINAKVERGLDRLYGFQHADGGWGWWKTDTTDPFMTAYVVDGLTIAKRAGYAVDESRIARGRERLRQMIDAGKTEDDKPIDAEARAYMIYALNESGEGANSYLDNLFAKRGELQPYGRALLALALKRGNDGRARAVATEIERTAITDSGLDAHWQSGRRVGDFDFVQANDTEATALSLKALAQIAPQSPLLAKAARWLVTNRQRGGYWLSTKQTAFAIYGLTDYLKVSQELSPDYTVEVYLNGEQVLSRKVEAADVSGAPTFVVERKGGQVGDRSEVRVVKRGRGSVYVAATLDYFTSAENLAAKGSKELRLTREYLRLRVTEKEDGKASWTIEPFTGEIRSGDLIVVRLRVEGARAQYLMIEDPIPAGGEQIERVSGINLNYNSNGWGDWYSAREFHDEKTVIFVNYFDGDATFQYAMRVQTPGAFRVGPARAELMYRPTVEANTGLGEMQILERK
ncbi:MAG: alpha-2-macroglobulin, partial [Pyrinomonadaceae bacterium]|nr:alpha-2-macroglobulin [Pyrinomonadaceae bacterium]